jgi:hypothetical protein
MFPLIDAHRERDAEMAKTNQVTTVHPRLPDRSTAVTLTLRSPPEV